MPVVKKESHGKNTKDGRKKTIILQTKKIKLLENQPSEPLEPTVEPIVVQTSLLVPLLMPIPSDFVFSGLLPTKKANHPPSHKE